MAGGAFGAFEHRLNAAGDRDVIVLDQDRVVETEAMIVTAAAAHRVFFQRPQTRRGLARANDARLGMRDARDESRRRGGDSGQVPEEVERHAFGAEDRPRIAGNGHHLGAALRRRAVVRMRRNRDLWCEPLERRGDQRQSGDHTGFTHHDLGAAIEIRRDGRDRGDVAGAAEIFFEGAGDRRFDFKRREESIGAH